MSSSALASSSAKCGTRSPVVRSTITPSEAFLALRDGESTNDPDVESRRARFDADVFPALAAAGAPRDELQLAWDFHTGPDVRALRQVPAARRRWANTSSRNTASTWRHSAPSHASRKRSGIGNDRTHWRTGTRGNTRSTRWAAP